jgi:hypothetical protein
VDRGAKRQYVWSDVDKIVAAGYCREHARLVKLEGVKVETLEETEMAHITALVKDGKKYWSTVERFWEGSK